MRNKVGVLMIFFILLLSMFSLAEIGGDCEKLSTVTPNKFATASYDLTSQTYTVPTPYNATAILMTYDSTTIYNLTGINNVTGTVLTLDSSEFVLVSGLTKVYINASLVNATDDAITSYECQYILLNVPDNNGSLFLNLILLFAWVGITLIFVYNMVSLFNKEKNSMFIIGAIIGVIIISTTFLIVAQIFL